MKKYVILSFIPAFFLWMLAGCGGGGGTTSTTTTTTPPPTTNTLACDADLQSGVSLSITQVPQSMGTTYTGFFCKYMEVIAPNQKPIRIFAQNQISNEQLVRAHRILKFFLTPVEASAHGADKSDVVNAMANNNAQLLLLNGSDDGSNNPPSGVDGQPLYDTELVVEGTEAYINNDYENHRDAAFEEILHLVHDYGIGTTGSGGNPTYQAVIDSARENAMSNSLWPTAGVDTSTLNWIEELRQEGSLSQEYLASVIDSYYGYWGAYTESEGGMWGIYIAKVREDVASKDPQGYAAIQQFFGQTVTYLARIDSGFNGTFMLSFDPAVTPYTHKSQYLVNAQLTGSNDSNLTGNDHDNRLAGNAGTNILDGKQGTDTAFFQGNFSEYSTNIVENIITVQDMTSNRDGVTELRNIERLEFKDQTLLFTNGELIKETL
ncbi:hypothetical protein [Aliikangiella coralliicola]|uniref:hypothetical protein n=1 Tax=Aliikangiella coralliicola TaxID=2592383 RepID=UPI001AEF6517|nr:hypothetical protein [Aliikangiella coralliicola]